MGVTAGAFDVIGLAIAQHFPALWGLAHLYFNGLGLRMDGNCECYEGD
jgi:hypothetical protein